MIQREKQGSTATEDFSTVEKRGYTQPVHRAVRTDVLRLVTQFVHPSISPVVPPWVVGHRRRGG